MVSGSSLAIGVFGALLLLPVGGHANDINPHLGEDSCQACHSKVPSPLEVEAGEYFLLKDSIDETCGQCHKLYIGQDSHTSTGHPTGIKMALSQDQPFSLPLNDGYITCKTCHRCIADISGPTFAMLRISNTFDSSDEERSELCRQCHKGY